MPRNRSQRGMLKRLSAGRYAARWYQYRKQEDGAEKRVCRDRVIMRQTADYVGLDLEYDGPITKTDAQRVLDMLIAQDAGGYIPPNRGATVEQVAREYIRIAKPSWGAHMAKVEENIILNHIVGRLGTDHVCDVDAVRLQDWLNGYVEANASRSLLKKLLVNIRNTFDMAVAKKIIIANPARDPIQKLKAKSRRRPSERALNVEECRRLLAATIGRDHLILRIFIQLGLRPEELFVLRRNDWDGECLLRIDEVFVLGGTEDRAKSEASESSIYVPAQLATELKFWLSCNEGGQDAILFPSPHGVVWDYSNYLDRVLKPIAVRAGVMVHQLKEGQTSGINYQILRRTCATLFGKAAKDPKTTQTQLRHADPTITLRHYQKSIPDEVKAAAVNFENDLMDGR